MGRILLLSKAKINKNDVVVDEAKEYMKERGYKYNDDYVDVNKRKAKKIAEYYEKASHDPNNEDVKNHMIN